MSKRKLYTIPAGVVCSVAKDDDRRAWQRWVMTRTVQFENYRSSHHGAYLFEFSGWLLLVRGQNVKRAVLIEGDPSI